MDLVHFGEVLLNLIGQKKKIISHRNIKKRKTETVTQF